VFYHFEEWREEIESDTFKIRNTVYPNKNYYCVVASKGNKICKEGVPIVFSREKLEQLQEIKYSWTVQSTENEAQETYESIVPLRFLYFDKDAGPIFCLGVVDMHQEKAKAFEFNRKTVFFGVIPYRNVSLSLLKDVTFWTRKRGAVVRPSFFKHIKEDDPSMQVQEMRPFG